MAKATYRAAPSDGLPARVAPAWTEEKLRILDCYLNGFAKACRKAGGWYALDAFAGGGLNLSELSGGEIPGSPRIALEASSPPADLVVVCERDHRARDALKVRLAPYGPRARIFAGDANDCIGEMLALIPPGAPSFAFLDPEGSELRWTTVRAVAAHKDRPYTKMEQLILLPTDMGFVRLLSLREPLKPELAEKVSEMYGNEEWRAIWEDRRAERISADVARTRYVALYARGLKELGYRHVQERQIVKPGADGRPGSPMYFLLHASDNDAGGSIMDWCFNKQHVRVAEEQGQIALLSVPVAPRKRRLADDED